MPPVAAGLLVFFTSAAVLVLEILAGRLLAPYVGVTLETYTGIIGTVLAGIAVGNWLGGRLADRVEPRRLLGPMLALGGVLALVSPVAVSVLGSATTGSGPVTIVVLAFAGFFLPAMVLSGVTPTVVKIQLGDLGETGSVVGRLAGLGTAGAILGTFAAGFLLVATLASTTIVLGVGIALVVAGVATWLSLHRTSARHTVAVVGIAGLSALLTLSLAGPCEYESPYFCARVIPDPDREGGRLLMLDTVRHSYVDLDDPTHLEFTYAQTIGDVLGTIAPPGEPLDALHVGGGGFTMPRYIEATRPGSHSVVLELDPVLLEVAREELGLETGPNLKVVIGDARLTIDRQPDAAFDVVIGDAFGGLTVPWHLTTVEFLEKIEAKLEPGGVYAMNLIDFPPLLFARAEARTFQEVFDHVAVLAPPSRLQRASGGNFVLVGSDRRLPVDEILAANDARGDDEAAATGSELDAFTGPGPVLTDDYAPVDQFMNPYRTP